MQKQGNVDFTPEVESVHVVMLVVLFMICQMLLSLLQWIQFKPKYYPLFPGLIISIEETLRRMLLQVIVVVVREIIY